MSAVDLNKLSVEDLGRCNYKLYQLNDGFKFGTDSVLLAWFASSLIRKSIKEPRVLELGANTGAVSILVAARNSTTFIDAIEIMEQEAEVLALNITENCLEGRVRGFNSDIRNLPKEVKDTQYNIVMFNPPYFVSEKSIPVIKTSSSDGNRLEGRFEVNGSMEDFVKVASSRLIPSSGYACMVMRANRLVDALNAYRENGLKPTHLMMVHPFENREASVFLLAGKKNSKGTDIKILPPLIVNRIDDVTGDIISTKKIIDIYEKEHSDCFI